MASNVQKDDKVHLQPGQNYSNMNTIRNTQWSLNTWNEWRYQINKFKVEREKDVIPSLAELPTLPLNDIDILLKKFVEDIKMPDGSEYPPDSIKNIIYGIQRHLRIDIPDISLFERYTKTFKRFQLAYSKKIKEITKKGISSKTRKAQAVSEEMEKRLWELGAFGFQDSVGLINAVFYYTSKVFGLIAGESLRKMDMKYFKFEKDNLGKYVELDGEFAQSVSCRHYKCGHDPLNGSIRQYQNPDNPRCYYNLLEYYIKLIRKSQLTGALFLKPTNNKMPTFSNQALGENNLASKLSQIMKTYRIAGYYTNHSIILSVSMGLGGKGINLRRLTGTSWSILDICKFLDPPVGEVVKDTEVLQIARLAPLIPVKSVTGTILTSKPAATATVTSKPATGTVLGSAQATGTIILQQQGGQFILQPFDQQKSGAYQPTMLQQMSLPLVTQGTVTQIIPNKPDTQNKTETNQSGSKKSAVRWIKPKVKHVTQEKESESTQSNIPNKPVFPLYLSAAAADSTSMSTEGHGDDEGQMPEDQDDSVTEDYEYDPPGLIIKEEPFDDYDYFGNQTSTSNIEENLEHHFKDENSNDTYNSDTSATITSTDNDFKYETSFENPRKRKLGQSDESNNEGKYKTDKKAKSKPSESQNKAEVVLSFSKNSETGMLKQEVSVVDNDQEIFTSSSSYKTGRSVPDFDLSLGDFLPENCVIRPSDIQFKRIATTDGGKIVMNVTYSDHEKD